MTRAISDFNPSDTDWSLNECHKLIVLLLRQVYQRKDDYKRKPL